MTGFICVFLICEASALHAYVDKKVPNFGSLHPVGRSNLQYDRVLLKQDLLYRGIEELKGPSLIH